MRRAKLCWASVFLGILFCVLATGVGAVGASAPIPPTIAVVSFANLSGQYISQIEAVAAELLTTLLAQTRTFSVVERARVSALLQEMGFVYSGLVDQERSAVQIGKLLGADFIALGTILDYSTDKVGYSGYGIYVGTTIYSMQVAVKLVEVTSGSLVYADLLEDSHSVTEFSGLRLTLQNVERTLLTKVLQRFVEGLKELEIFTPGQAASQEVVVPFESSPTGANVEINGVYVGSTPMSFPLESGVIYQIRITYPGTIPWEMQVRAYAGLVVRVTLVLKTEGQP